MDCTGFAGQIGGWLLVSRFLERAEEAKTYEWAGKFTGEVINRLRPV